MPTFDGDNLLITLDDPGANPFLVDVQDDIYSEWKEWVLTAPQNQGYPPAFRTAGGDGVTETLNAGAYSFLRNDLGWRIKPFEADGEYTFVGNIVGQDTSKPILVPTTGNFNVLINGIQPITTVAQGSGGASAQEVWEYLVEGDFSAEELLRLAAAAAAAKLSGAVAGQASTITLRDVSDTKDRIVAEVDAAGNRTAFPTLDVSD
jgi:hypothetical protein